MPLLQSRVVAIINAALDYKQALEALSGLISDLAAQNHSPNPPDRIELLETIHAAALNYQSQLKQPFNSPHVILSEYEYYSKNAARNAHNAEMLRQKRAALAGGPPRRHRAPIYAAYDLSPIETPAERRGETAPNAPHNYNYIPQELLASEEEMPIHIREAAAAFDIKDNRRREIEQQAASLRDDILRKAPMIMNQRNVTLETVQREAQTAYDEYIEEQTNDEGF